MFFKSSNIYKPTYKLYHYQDDIFRLVFFPKREKGWEIEKKETEGNQDEVKRCSLSRVKREIREICICNDFKYFVTLTINSKNCDRFSLQECQDNLQKLIHNYSRRLKYQEKKKFHYILITEKHKDGAFHFHGLFSDLLKSDTYINENGYISSHFFDSLLGFCSFSEIKDILKCSNYIMKYITKDCVKNESNRIYFCSKGLNKPETYEFTLDRKNNMILSNNFWNYENDFCKLKDFHFSELNDNDKMFLFSNFNQ